VHKHAEPQDPKPHITQDDPFKSHCLQELAVAFAVFFARYERGGEYVSYIAQSSESDKRRDGDACVVSDRVF